MNRRNFIILSSFFIINFNLFEENNDNIVNYYGWILKEKDI